LWLAHVHANDVNQQGPGMAVNGTDFKAVFAALKEVGYHGYVSVESFDFSPGAEETARRSMECMQWARA
jgi:sugar phosphate isomerase/epimerase